MNDKLFCPFLFASENKIMLQGFSIILEAQGLIKSVRSEAMLSPGPISLSLSPCCTECRGPGPTLVRFHTLGPSTGCRDLGHIPSSSWGCCLWGINCGPHKVQLWTEKDQAELSTHAALLAGAQLRW